MVKLSKRSKSKLLKQQDIVEDLDLDIGDVEGYGAEGLGGDEEVTVVHNKRREGKLGLSGSVLPSDAHKIDGHDLDDEVRGAYKEEEDLAESARFAARRRTADVDFDVAGVSLVIRPKERATFDAAPSIEAVERDFALLTSSERLEIIRKESPELLKMLEELRRYLDEVKTLTKPLHDLLFTRRVAEGDKPLVSFLETKVQLMLSYCMHVTFYLLLKTEGKKIAGHPVVDTLVEIRVYLEKMWPLEQKLQYTLNKLLSGKSTGGAKLEALRPLKGHEGGVYEAPRAVVDEAARERRKQQRALREAEELEAEELSMMNRVRTKQSTALRGLSGNSIQPASTGYHEDEDQFFSKFAAELEETSDGDASDEDEGPKEMSLIEKLRKKRGSAVMERLGATSSGRREHKAVDEDEHGSEDDDGSAEEDLLDDDADYDALVAEERDREDEAEEKKRNAPQQIVSQKEVDRRKAGKKIEAHRGLTKARPKDRKNPRIAQRRKYEKGMRIHKAQVRTVQPEPAGGFTGVQAIKPHITRAVRL